MRKVAWKRRAAWQQSAEGKGTGTQEGLSISLSAQDGLPISPLGKGSPLTLSSQAFESFRIQTAAAEKQNTGETLRKGLSSRADPAAAASHGTSS